MFYVDSSREYYIGLDWVLIQSMVWSPQLIHTFKWLYYYHLLCVHRIILLLAFTMCSKSAMINVIIDWWRLLFNNRLTYHTIRIFNAYIPLFSGFYYCLHHQCQMVSKISFTSTCILKQKRLFMEIQSVFAGRHLKIVVVSMWRSVCGLRVSKTFM